MKHKKAMACLDTNPPSTAKENHIRKLPVELLVQIFLSAYLTSRQRNRFQLPFNLLSVTSHWRKIVLSEPRLWTYAFYGNSWLGPQTAPPLKAISFQLTHSRNHLLEIAIDLRWCDSPKMVDEFIKVLLQHKDRWVALSLYAGFEVGVMEHVLQNLPEEFPELREFAMECESEDDPWIYSRIRKRLVCPKLQDLRFRGVTLQYAYFLDSVLPSLSSIFLAYVLLDWDDWSAVLHHGLKLVEIKLLYVAIIGDGGKFASRRVPVPVPHLQRLSLMLESCGDTGTVSTHGLDRIITAFVAPKLHTLLINVHNAGTTLQSKVTWDKAMPGLKTLVVRNQGDINAIRSALQRCFHISHVQVYDPRASKDASSSKILEYLADPSTGPFLDRLKTLTFSMPILTYEGWEKFLLGKKLQVYIDSRCKTATRERMDKTSLQECKEAIENIRGMVALEIRRVPGEKSQFGNMQEFGDD